MIAVAAKVTVVVPAPGADNVLDGENCTVMPAGSPVTARVMAELNVEFGVVLNVTLLELPVCTLAEVAEGASVKVGYGATVTEICACFFQVPLVPVTVAV